jgi:FdhE protein
VKVEAKLPDQEQTPGSFPVFIFPDPSRIFLDRSRRFAALAERHTLADWLSFLGRLTGIQHELLQEYPPLPMPDDEALSFARKHLLPPIAAQSWPRDPYWQQTLLALIRQLLPQAPALARDAMERIKVMDSTALEAFADRVLRFEFDDSDKGCLPFVAAALQVHWTALAAGLDQMKISTIDVPGVCPSCGFPPVASIVRLDGEVTKLRYLHCGLCNTEWHLERVTCAACRDSNGIAYRFIEGSDGGACAETCDACRSYLKIFYREKSPQADPVADDLSTLTLDLLVDEAGYNRMSPNLLLTPAGKPGLADSR